MPDAEEIAPVEPVVEETPFVLPDDFAQTVQGWEVPVEVLPEAVALYKGLQTEEGVIDNFVVLGQKLGFGIKELERLFADEPIVPVQTAPTQAAPIAPIEQEDPDRLMSAAEVRALVEAERQAYDAKFTDFQTQQTAIQQQAVVARQNEIRGMVDAWFTEQGITDQQTKAMISTFGERTLAPNADTMDPKVIMAGFQAGKEAYDSFIETEAEARLRKKAVIAAAQPAAVGTASGGSEGGEGDSQPKYETLGAGALDEAKRRVRAKFAAGG